MHAFTPSLPLYSPRRRVLQEAQARGWLSPSMKLVADKCVAALNVGTLPRVDPLPLISGAASPNVSGRTRSPTSERGPSAMVCAVSTFSDGVELSAAEQHVEKVTSSAVVTLEDSASESDVEELCRRLDVALQWQNATQVEEFVVDEDAPSGVVPRLKGAARWLGREDLPFVKIRELAANRLLRMFDEEVLDGRLLGDGAALVTVSWSGRLTKTAGITRMKRLACGKRIAAIELSEKVVDEPFRLYNTLAHELCHALQWIVDETAKPPHGQHFKSWANQFRRWDGGLVITTCHEYEIRYKFNYVCAECGQVYGRHSRSIDTSKKVCGRCRGMLQLQRD